MHLFRVGEYKSSAEPYIRNDASPESKEADLYWMNGVWNDYLKDIGAARKLDPKDIAAQIDNYADFDQGRERRPGQARARQQAGRQAGHAR